MSDVSRLLDALGAAARENRKDEFDRLERELLAHFDGGFDRMPESVYQSYLEIDRLWPVVPTRGLDDDADTTSKRRHVVRVILPADDEAWLRQVGERADRSISSVLSGCLRLIREDESLASRVVELLRGRSEGR